MIPVSFDESNGYCAAPPELGLNEVETLSVWVGMTFINPEVQAPVLVSCWKPTQEELDEINRTKRIWLMVLGHHPPPVKILGNSPFIDNESNEDEEDT